MMRGWRTAIGWFAPSLISLKDAQQYVQWQVIACFEER